MHRLSRREFLAANLAAAATAATLPALGTAQPADPATLTLRRASDLIRRRDLSPVELTEACLRRIDTYDSALNAFITITRDDARAAARALEREQRNGSWRGPLHPTVSLPCGFTADGLPIGLQISGAHFDEPTVIALAHAYEQATGWHERHPNLTI